MAQTPQAEETGGVGETTPPTAEQPQGLFGNSTTILLLIFAVAVFWWTRRRRGAMEERLRAQRREADETAARSAMDVAHVMRKAAPPGAAAAAAAEGLASAARMPASRPPEPGAAEVTDVRTTIEEAVDGAETAGVSAQDEARARVIERAEAAAAAERAAEEQAALAAREAELAGESATRRIAAAEAAAEEARADTADAMSAGLSADLADPADREREAGDALRAAMRELDSEIVVPLGAVAGDGTAICPPEFPIKGNAQSSIYHKPGQVSYPPTIAEFCFASAEAAEAAGFRQSRARGKRTQD
jgi:hypothetical protein